MTGYSPYGIAPSLIGINPPPIVMESDDPSNAPTLWLTKSFRLGGCELAAIRYGQGANMIHAVSRTWRVTVFDPQRGHLFRSFQLETRDGTCADWSPSGRHLALGTWRGTEIYDAWSGEIILKTPQHVNIVSRVAWSPQGDKLAICAGAIRIWGAASERYLQLLDGPSGNASLAWNKEGTLLASANSSGLVVIWDVQSGHALHRIQACSTMIMSLAWSSNSRFLVIPASTRGWNQREGIGLTVFDFTTGDIAAEIVGPADGVKALAFRPSGEVFGELLVSKGMREVRLWRGDTWQCVAVMSEEASGYMHMQTCFHPFEPRLYTLGDLDRSVRCWEFNRNLLKSDQLYAPMVDGAEVIDLTPPPTAVTTSFLPLNRRLTMLLDKVDVAVSSTEKGRTLEALCQEMFLSLKGLKVESYVRTETEEIDLSIQNWGANIAWLERHGFYILAECKNWSDKCGKNEFVLFQEKLRNRNRTCNLGFLISWNGFANTVGSEALRGSREEHVVALLTGDDLRKAARTGDFANVLFDAYNRSVMS